jgi:predicted RNA-binding protein with PUA-like domain
MAVALEAYPNPDEPDGKFCRVRVRPLAPAAREVSLREIKADPRFADLALVRQSRLSVSPVGEEHWRILCGMAGVEA